MQTIEQKATELCAKGERLDYGRDQYDRGYWGGYNAVAYNSAKEMADFVIDKATEWLKQNIATFTETPSMLDDFIKAMKN